MRAEMYKTEIDSPNHSMNEIILSAKIDSLELMVSSKQVNIINSRSYNPELKILENVFKELCKDWKKYTNQIRLEIYHTLRSIADDLKDNSSLLIYPQLVHLPGARNYESILMDDNTKYSASQVALILRNYADKLFESRTYKNNNTPTPIKKPKKTLNSLDRYFKEIESFPLLDSLEEIELAKKSKKDDMKALDMLMKGNLRFVVRIAKEYKSSGLPLEDLISEGNLGLIKAAERFDETRGFKFISYAVYWIRRSILEALSEDSRTVKLPFNRVRYINKVEKALKYLTKKYKREPTVDELASYTKMNPKDCIETLILRKKAHSLDQRFDDQEGSKNLYNITADPNSENPDAEYNKMAQKRAIGEQLKTLKGREAEIIKLYYGIDQDRPLTLEKIGEKYKLTRQRVSQIKINALRRLMHSSRMLPLKKCLE